MKRYFINLAALFLGLVLGGFATFASAETCSSGVCTEPASQSLQSLKWKVSGAPSHYDDAAASCAASWAGSFVVVVDWSTVNCRKDFSGTIITMGQSHAYCPVGSISQNGCTGTVLYSCPAGQGWTLSGSSCTRPACTAGQQRDANGQCVSVACPSGQYSSGYYGGSAPAYACASNGCGVSFTGAYPAGRDAQGNLYAQGSYSYTGGNQGDCTPGQGGAVVAPSTATATPSSTSPGPNGCAAGDGVITSSSGKVACVPAGTPGASTPVPNSNTKTETFPDGSTKTTTNNQVCTGDGACQTITTTTVTNNSSGAPGMAGTPGTTTGTTEKPPSPTSSFCAENPSIQLCKGGMNEEATQKEVRDELKKLTTPNVSDDSAITGATHSQQSGDDNQAETDKLMTVAEGNFDPTTANRSAWADALSSGWLTPVPASTCSPYTSTFSGKTWTWDYCPTAAKISEIGAYALWFMFSVGVFVMLTGGRNAST